MVSISRTQAEDLLAQMLKTPDAASSSAFDELTSMLEPTAPVFLSDETARAISRLCGISIEVPNDILGMDVHTLAQALHAERVEDMGKHGWKYSEMYSKLDKLSPYMRDWGSLPTDRQEHEISRARRVQQLMQGSTSVPVPVSGDVYQRIAELAHLHPTIQLCVDAELREPYILCDMLEPIQGEIPELVPVIAVLKQLQEIV